MLNDPYGNLNQIAAAAAVPLAAIILNWRQLALQAGLVVGSHNEKIARVVAV